MMYVEGLMGFEEVTGGTETGKELGTGIEGGVCISGTIGGSGNDINGGVSDNGDAEGVSRVGYSAKGHGEQSGSGYEAGE